MDVPGYQVQFSETRLRIQQENAQRRQVEVVRNDSPTLPSVIISEFYKHVKIPEDTGGLHTTRLLVLEPGDEDAPLQGRLQVLWLGLGQEYKALSYVWGPPRFTEKIAIEGKRLDITASLASALRQFRSPTKPLPIWIDQICINQKDTLERNAQVSLMHDIFRHAEEVLVWLGPDPDKHASRAFRLLKSLGAILDDDLLSSLCAKSGADFDWIPDRYWTSLQRLCEQQWFRRAWIPQEIGTDAPAAIHWGAKSIEWETLCIDMQKLEKCWTLRKKYDINTYAVTTLFRRFVRQEGTPSERARSNFVFQLCLSARNKATDPRDYVYSQLGHYSAFLSNGIRIIDPDYDNSVHAIYHEVAIRLLQRSPTLITLNAVSHNSESKSAASSTARTPSWVPRWDVRGSLSVIGHPGRFRASGDRDHELTFQSKFRCLVVKGIRIDTIERISDTFQAEPPSALSPKQVRAAWCLCLRSPRKLETRELFGDHRYGPDGTKSSLEAFLDVIAPKAVMIESASSTSSFKSGLAALEQLFPPKRKDLRAISVPESETKSNPTLWSQVAEGHAIGRRLAVTNKGYFAMAPPDAVKGDQLCVLFGGETPYVLRELPSKGCQLVGETYAHGLTNGEAMKMLETELLSEETFEIR